MAYPRVHWSTGGAAYAKVGNSISFTLTDDQRKIMDGDLISTNNVNIQEGGVAIHLPAVIAVDKVGLRVQTWGNSNVDVSLEFSTDSSDGIDGTWNTMTTITLSSSSPPYIEYSVTQTQCTWLRFSEGRGYHLILYNVSIFGELQNPSYEFWDESGAVELNTANYPLTFQPAGNSADSHQELRFKIKNTSASVHSYTVTVAKYKYDTDAVVTSGITLSTDLGGSPAKTSSVTINNVAGGGFSGVIRVFADVTIAGNPADGYHYFSIDVVQS